MSRIVCATNAGEDSRAVHIAAFRRAVQSDCALTFLHVLGGVDFFEQPDRMQSAIVTEMEWLLHALVRVARDRSGAADVESDIVVRTGVPAETILAYVRETGPETLLVGVPREGDTSVFHDTGFDDFVASAEALGVRVEQVSTELDQT